MNGKVCKTEEQSISEFLRCKRAEKSLSLREVSDATGINSSYLHRLESGERKNPSAKIVFELLRYFNADQLLPSFSGTTVIEYNIEDIFSQQMAIKINNTVISSQTKRMIVELLNCIWSSNLKDLQDILMILYHVQNLKNELQMDTEE